MKIGDRIYIEELQQYGILREVSADGQPLKAQVTSTDADGLPVDRVIDLVGLTVTVLGFLEKILMAIREFFRSKKKK